MTKTTKPPTMPEGTVYFDYVERTEKVWHTTTWWERLVRHLTGRR